MLKIKVVNQFKKDFKRYRHDRGAIEALEEVIIMLRKMAKLPEKYCDHSLSGEYKGMRECHIKQTLF